MHLVIKGAGEFLEHYSITRAGFDIASYLLAQEKLRSHFDMRKAGGIQWRSCASRAKRPEIGITLRSVNRSTPLFRKL